MALYTRVREPNSSNLKCEIPVGFITIPMLDYDTLCRDSERLRIIKNLFESMDDYAFASALRLILKPEGGRCE